MKFLGAYNFNSYYVDVMGMIDMSIVSYIFEFVRICVLWSWYIA